MPQRIQCRRDRSWQITPKAIGGSSVTLGESLPRRCR